MAVLTINNQTVDIGNERLNLIQAAGKAGILIPHYCWHPALTVVASCRMCLVEVGEKKADGTVTMQPKVTPACQTPAKDGTVVITNSPKATHAQEQTLESLLINHPLDCPVCDKAGECTLQDYSYHFGRAGSRMIETKNHPENKDHIGDQIKLFTDRCILCSRCVRFTREISGTAELLVINRGDHSEIDIFPGEPCNNKLAGNVVDLCPVGALCSKDFLYKQRVWSLKARKSVCADCSTGCSIFVDHNKDIVYRLRPRENPLAQGYFMCDEGRFGYHYVNAPERLRQPWVRRDGALIPADIADLIPALRHELITLASRDGAAIAGILSPFLTCEEAFLLAKFLKGLSPDVTLALGRVPVIGQDDTYPKDRRGSSMEPVKFTIHAEKCPNRRGVEEVLKHFQGEVLGFDQIAGGATAGRFQAIYVAAAYPPRQGGWITEDQADALAKAPLLIVQDLFPSPASARARYFVPASTFAEKDGVFVNFKGLAQAIHHAVRPPRDSRSDGQIFLDLLERRGIVHAPTLRAEMAKEIPFFSPLGVGKLGDNGILLNASSAEAR